MLVCPDIRTVTFSEATPRSEFDKRECPLYSKTDTQYLQVTGRMQICQITEPMKNRESLRKITRTAIVLAAAFAGWLDLYTETGHAFPSGEISASISSRSFEQSKRIGDLIATLNQADADARQRAAIALGNAGDAGAVEPLIKALKDSDYFVRCFAAEALGKLRDPRALDPLVQALHDEHYLVRRTAAQALGSLKDRRAVEPLVKASENEHFLVQRSAAEALGAIGDPSAVDPLIKALANDDSYIQNGAAIALAKIGDPAIPGLVAKLDDSQIGSRVAEVLKELGRNP
jgi:HEAT repeat protein